MHYESNTLQLNWQQIPQRSRVYNLIIQSSFKHVCWCARKYKLNSFKQTCKNRKTLNINAKVEVEFIANVLQSKIWQFCPNLGTQCCWGSKHPPPLQYAMPTSSLPTHVANIHLIVLRYSFSDKNKSYPFSLPKFIRFLIKWEKID
jgi:hypothetical protein